MQKPDPLADLELTRGIRERVSARGDVITPLDEASARKAVRELIELGAEAITVSLLHSYANPQHEQRLKAIVEEIEPDMTVSLSSEILPEFREYERTLVTVMNAYVRPSMRRYLTGFEEKLHRVQFQSSVNIVRSDGGLMSVERASQSPVHTMLSGPAGGVSGAAFMASLAGYPQALGFDMGGTSTDVSLIQDGKPTISRQTSIGYYPIKVPSVDVHSVGAGGGSIAHVPMTGALRVGPESAGAVPGPACYGKGGDRPTVTDANVVLGRLPPRLLGGKMMLDTKASEEAVAKIARALSLDLHQAAQGILDIVNENMLGALRLVTVQKGLDPQRLRAGAVRRRGPAPWQRHGHARRLLSRHRAADARRLVGLGLSLFRREKRIRPDLRAHHRRRRPEPDRRHSDQAGARRERVAARGGHRRVRGNAELRGRRPLLPAGLRVFPGNRSRSAGKRCAQRPCRAFWPGA